MPHPHSTPIAPFIGPIVPEGTVALLYPQDDSLPRLVSWPIATLEAAKDTPIPYFDQNPAACPFCSRPYEVLSIGPITLLFTCLHLDDDADPVSTNASVVQLLNRLDSVHRPPLGNVIALKYSRPALPLEEPSKDDLFSIPFVPVLPTDVEAIDEMIVFACFQILRVRGDWTPFVPFEDALRTVYEDGSRVWPPFPSADALAAAVAENNTHIRITPPANQRPGNLPCFSTVMSAPVPAQDRSDSDNDSAITIYTDDDVNDQVFLDRLARMRVSGAISAGSLSYILISISDEAPLPSTPSGRHSKTKLKHHNPPPVPRDTRPPIRQPSPPVAVPPSPPPPQTPPSAPAFPKTPQRLYAYQSQVSPSTQTPHWHVAAAATQGVPGGRPLSLIKRKKTKVRSKAYAVIRGRSVGVYEVWDGPSGARQHTDGFPFALYAGFPTRVAAQAAFDFCVDAHWSSMSPTVSIPLQLIPRPVRDETDLQAHAPRQAHDPCVEALLNVLGVPCASHDSWPTYQEALAEFQHATAAKTVSAGRPRWLK
ncbi:hypothetical protein C8F01DRAFT_1087960 [Mycena amicta]|nr:hypothetical protein C8F01DRAFT_1087960 [Mycena amicta]